MITDMSTRAHAETIASTKVKADRDAILKAAIIAYRNRKEPEIYLPEKLKTQSNLRNKNF